MILRNKASASAQVEEAAPRQNSDGSLDNALKPDLDVKRTGFTGAIGMFVLIGVLGAWASFSVIGGAVIASGQTVVQGKPKQVQSLDGGAIADIFVRDGDTIAQGDVLMRLDPTLLQINLDSARGRLASALALHARLKAEQRDADEIDFVYQDLPFDTPDTGEHEKIQIDIFNARAAVREGQQEQLAESLLQFGNQSAGIAGQISALEDQIALLERDIGNMGSLAKQGLARQSQMSELQRAKSQVIGELARLQAEQARVNNARRDASLQTLQATRNFHEEVVTQMREVSAEINALTLEIVTWYDRLSRIDITAPVAGVVHQMQVTTQGGVIPPGGNIAQIIPTGEQIDFDVRVDPLSIDQVYVGQSARLMVSSLDPQTTPQVKGRVAAVSPDVITDPRSGQPYYNVSLELDPEAKAQFAMLDIMPGMPMEAYLQTGDRSVLSYLVHPIASHLRRALRE